MNRNMILATGVVALATMASAGEPEPKEVKGEGTLIEFLNGVEGSKASVKREEIVKAIRELGKIGGINAVKTLTDWLDFHVNEIGVIKNDEIAPIEDSYPAVKSILQITANKKEIKEEAVQTILLSIVSAKRSEIFLGNAVHLLVEILGTPELAKKRLLEMAKTKEAQGKTLRTLGERMHGPPENDE